MYEPNIVKVKSDYHTFVAINAPLTMKGLTDDQILEETESFSVVLLNSLAEHRVNANDTDFVVIIVCNDTHR